MIEWREPNNRIWLKAIASLLVITFLWYDIAWSADLFYTFGKPAAESTQRLPPPKDSNVTNYDVLNYNQKQSIAQKLLPSNRDRAQSGSFAPGYVQEQQAKHEEIVGQKQAAEDLSWMLRNPPKRRDEEVDLKKKQGGAGMGSGSTIEEEDADYTLEEPDDIENPHELSLPEDSWNQVGKYDITKMNIDELMANAEKKEDENGVSYWLGTGEVSGETSRMIMKVIYEGTGDDKKIKEVYTGYALREDGTYQAKYRIDYTYSGDNISETRKYDTSSGSDRLVEKSLYEGSDDSNHIKMTIFYDKDGKITNRRDFTYVNDTLKEALLYDTDSETEGSGDLAQKTVFSGEKDKEIADYTKNYYTNKKTGEQSVTSTTVYYYIDGKRATETSEQDYRYSQSKQITFRGDPDSNGDGALSDEELASAIKTSMLVYDDTHRLAGEEMADYRVTYNSAGDVTSTTVYFYENGNRAEDANYRECLTTVTTYKGNLDTDGDGKISDEELANGVKTSVTFYDTQYRLKGEEVASYTIKYNSKGDITSYTVMLYDADGVLTGASGATKEDALKVSVTYAAKSIAEDEFNSDGTLKDGEDG
ncbi:MAG: hypothetical protein WCY36_06060, partial [Candidatus Omnitrophota bacterium]